MQSIGELKKPQELPGTITRTNGLLFRFLLLMMHHNLIILPFIMLSAGFMLEEV